MTKQSTATKQRVQGKSKGGNETGTDVTAAAVSAPVAGVDEALAADMLANEGHRQIFDSEQLTIPRIALLQDLSPETKEYEGSYILGARPGMILNKLKRTLDAQIEFVPAKFVVRYIAWRPRKDGGGLVDQNLTREEVEENFQQDGIGRWVGLMAPREGEEPVKVEIQQTPEWVGFARSDSFDWSPVAISFPSTKSKVVRDINSTIDLTKMQVGDKRITPAAFFHLFEIGSFLDSSGDDKFFNFTAGHKGWCLDPQVRQDAKGLKESFEKGETVVEDIETPK